MNLSELLEDFTVNFTMELPEKILNKFPAEFRAIPSDISRRISSGTPGEIVTGNPREVPSTVPVEMPSGIFLRMSLGVPPFLSFQRFLHECFRGFFREKASSAFPSYAIFFWECPRNFSRDICRNALRDFF